MSTANALNLSVGTPLSGSVGGTGYSNGSNTLQIGANSKINQDCSTLGTPTFTGVSLLPTGSNNNLLNINAVFNSTGSFSCTVQNVGAFGQAQTLVIPDVGASSADFVTTKSALGQNITGALNLNGSEVATAVNGTFTPAVTFGGGSTGITYISQVGNYTICGHVCNFQIYVYLSSKGASTGGAALQNLPTASRGLSGGAFVFPLNLSSAVLVGVNGINGVMVGSAAAILMTDQTGTSLTDVHFNNNTEIFISGSYLI